MSHCPNTPAQHEAEGPQISAFNYLDGFLHGFTAASTTKGKVFAGPSLPALDTPWPLLSYPALPQQELYSFTSNVSIQNDVRVSAPSYPQSFPRIIDDELPQPVVSPGSTSSSFYQHISQNDSLPLENRERLSVSDEVVNSFPCQPFLVPGNLQFVSLPALAGSQYVGPALYEPEIFASRLDEGPVALLHKSATIRDQPGNVVDTYAFPTAEIGVPLQSWEQLGGKSTLGNANLKEQAVSPRSSAVDALRCSQSLEAPVSWPVAVSTKRVAPDAGQTVFRAYGTKRSRFSEKSRTSTARTRELGACEACRKKKIRCEQAKKEFAPCGRCARTPLQLLYAPCCRVEIIDVKLFRLGTTLDQNATLQLWMQSKEAGKGTLLLQDGTTVFEPPRRVQLTHDVCTTTFEVTISRYQPGPDDTTGYSWTDATGCKQKYELPPYYISDLAEAGRNLRQYILKARAEFTKDLLVNSNPIILKTFKEAERYYAVSKSGLVAGALMLWSATRMIERFWLITGDDMLGLPPMKQSIGPCRLNPYIEAVPVTPIMDTQLDEIAIKHVLVPLKSKLLRLLKAKFLEKKRENWYETFLVTFIILHSSEVVIGQVMDYSRRYGISFVPRSNDEGSLSHAYYHACKTVLVYFHFASGGAAPLSLGLLGPTPDTSVLSQQQIKFLCDMKDELLRQDVKLQNLKNCSMYEAEMFWCHQLLFPDWKADMPHSGPFLACTEKDFLLS